VAEKHPNQSSEDSKKLNISETTKGISVEDYMGGPIAFPDDEKPSEKTSDKK